MAWLTFLRNHAPVVSGKLPLQAKQPLLIASLQQFMDESRGGVKANR
jgi:hypothetical protein